MPYKEEEDRVCEVKCPKGGGVCGYGATPILLPIFLRIGLVFLLPESLFLRIVFWGGFLVPFFIKPRMETNRRRASQLLRAGEYWLGADL